MKKLKYYWFIGLLALLFYSCETPTPSTKDSANSTYIPEYAKYFKIDYYDHYKRITITNPWENESMNLEYYISTDSLADYTPNGPLSFSISTSPTSLVTLSSPILGLINLLNQRDLIKGVTDPELIYDSISLQLINEGEIKNIGKSIQVNMEKLMILNPDLIIGSGWDQMSADYKKMIQLN
ncbi:MAG: hypothetical protein GQ527_12990, partial [Bacteroidales bacterium]|nr:hypothetical protein [Bacteroidales bacterium]